MEVTDPRTNKVYHYYYTDPAFVRVEPGTRVRAGNAWYLHQDEPVRNFAEFWKLRIVE